MRMTPTQYARMRGASPDVLRYHMQRGAIARAADGTIESDEADEVWWEKHQARARNRVEGTAADSRLNRVRIASTVAKTQLAKLKLAEETDTLVSAPDTAAAAEAELLSFWQALRAIDPRPLLSLGLSLEVTQQLLREFLSLTLAGLDDVVRGNV